MNNLKRVLSLVMSGAMLVGMLTVGASAANTKFSDADEITHTEAVNTMAALGVIKGKDTGAYDPKANVTRAEMAKIICVMLNGGEEPAWGADMKTNFSDTQTHWARNYIAYCANKGIIAGQGDGTFNPDGNVTGAQAAKMMLVALNYDAEIFHLTGNKWEDNTNDLATSEAKLYTDIKALNTSAALNRDDAAQMAYNCLESVIMRRTFDKVSTTGEITYKYAKDENGTTFLTEYFGADVFVGKFDGNADTLGIKDGYIQVTGDLEGLSGTRTTTFPYDLDIAYVGEEVKVIYKEEKVDDNKPGKDDKIFGVYVSGGTEVVNVTLNDVGDAKGDLGNGKIKVDGTLYKIKAPVTVNYNHNSANDVVKTSASALQAELKKTSGDTVKFILNGDGEITSAYVVNYTMAKVTAITSSKITLSGVGTIVIADNDVEEGLAKDDVVVYTKLYESDKDKALFSVKKAEVVEGKITAYDGTDTVSIDGEDYDIGKTSGTVNLTHYSTLVKKPYTSFSGKIGDTVALYMVGGLVGVINEVDSGKSDWALVIAENGQPWNASNMQQGKMELLLSDNTKVTYDVHKDSSIQLNADVDVGDLVQFSVSDGQAKIKDVVDTSAAASNTDAYATTANVGGTIQLSNGDKAWDDSTKTLKNAGVAAGDCVLFVKTKGTADFEAFKVRDLDTITVTATKYLGYVKDSSGKVTVAYLNLESQPAGATTNTLYGMITGGGSVIDEDGEYVKYTVWTNDGEKTVKVDNTWSAMTSVLGKGVYVTFKETTTGKYSATSGSMLVLNENRTASATSAQAVPYADHVLDVAVNEYSESDNTLSYFLSTGVTLSSGVYTGSSAQTLALDDKAVIVSVDRNGKKGTDFSGISSFASDTGYANVKLVLNSTDDKIMAIFVNTDDSTDINGEKTAIGDAYLVAAPVMDTTTGTAASKYPSTDFSVVADKTSGANRATVTLTVTYNGIETDADDTFTVTPSATAGGNNAVAASGNLTGIAPGKTWTCTIDINSADMTGLKVVVDATAVTTP